MVIRRVVIPVACALACIGCTGSPSRIAPGLDDAAAGGSGDATLADGGVETSVGDDSGDANAYPLLPAVPFHTQSRWILDADNRRFKLAGVSWYGAESPDFVVSGLDHDDVHAIARLIRQIGFNSVRIPWSLQLYEQNPVVADALLAKNTSLQGRHALDVLDAVIDAIAREGLVVILDNHRSRADWCCDTVHGDGLWHTAQYPESNFIADWQGIVQRYRLQPAVIGADLRNELRAELPDDAGACADCDNPPDAGCACLQPSWGDNNPLTDWPAAAERVAGAIQAIDPDLLIIVEGDFYATWFGANYRPVRLKVANHLVYSPHNYASSNGGASHFADYAAFKAAIDSAWGYITTSGQAYTAPLWVGEFGVNQNTPAMDAGTLAAAGDPNVAWWGWIRQYLADNDLDWAVWALNGTQASGYGRRFGQPETWGVLNTSWNGAASPASIAALRALQPATQGP